MAPTEPPTDRPDPDPMTRKPFLVDGRPMAMAHRGDTAGHPPGNTWSAFASAIDIGFDHIETDVQLSADGRVVIFHDDTLTDTTDGTGTVGDHPWSTLAELRYRSGDGSDEGIVPLDEAMDRWPDAYWNIDAKTADVVEPLLELIDERRATERVLITSFSHRTVRRLRSLAPAAMATGLSMPEVALARATSVLGLAPPTGGDAAQVPRHMGLLPIVDRRFVDACHRGGMAVHVWTVNDASEMHDLLDLGVEGIITDTPTTLREVLLDRGAWPPVHRSNGDIAP